MTSPSSSHGAGSEESPETDQIPRVGESSASTNAASPPEPTTGSSGSGSESESAAQRARAIAVLDEPLDDKDLEGQIRRPGMSRSTMILLLLLGAVVVFALGTFLGRATAPDTGPGSSPDVTGAIESVTPGAAGASQITVRTADNKLVVLGATPGTRVGVPRPSGVAGLRPGEQVIVSAEVNKVGGLDATQVNLGGGS